MKIMCSDKKQKIANNFLSSMISVVLIMTLISLFVHPVSLLHLYSSSFNKMFSEWKMQHSRFIDNVTVKCSLYNPKKQVECVANKFRRFNYSEKDRNFAIKTTAKMEQGALCRDYAIALDAVFRQLDWNTDFIYNLNYNENHIYNHVYKDGVYCDVNMYNYTCWIT